VVVLLLLSGDYLKTETTSLVQCLLILLLNDIRSDSVTLSCLVCVCMCLYYIISWLKSSANHDDDYLMSSSFDSEYHHQLFQSLIYLPVTSLIISDCDGH